MATLNLTESEKNEIIDLIKQGKPLPKENIKNYTPTMRMCSCSGTGEARP